MKKYLYITAFTLPIVAGPVWAQDETTPDETAPAPTEQMEDQTPGGDTGTTPDAPDAGTTTPDDGTMTPDAGTTTPDDGTTAPDDGTTLDSDPSAAEAPAEDGAPAAASGAVVPQQESAEILGDWILSTSVTSPDGETIGSIKDIIITEDGQITGVILGVGGFLGIGQKDIAVDYSELDIQYDGDAIELAMTREEAEAAPEYQYREKETAPAPVDDTMGTGGMDSGMGAGTGMGGDTGMGGTTVE
ncbi:PRC-barrel domain-containing protein [Celeribacter indicus]|nr:PRC-barrel domain-containing protein [Celeribacter indicus]SDW38485.1 PRC-barrel domain-containing protein [Celeribacter indicus]